MPEETMPEETYVYPTLSNEQKLVIREAQYMLRLTQENNRQSEQKASEALFTAIQTLAKDLNVPADVTNFDVTSLTFYKK